MLKEIRTDKFQKRFWKKVKMGTQNSCWFWTAAKQSSGYGSIGLNGKTYLAHRISYLMHYGEIPEGLVVRHLCHTKLCVNPHHLAAGTAQENVQDSVDSHQQPAGENHGRAKIPDEEVLKIRRLYATGKHSCREIARRYRLSKGYISQLGRGEYRKLPQAE